MGKRGPAPGTARKSPLSGRKPGQLNHATADVKALAQRYGPSAIAEAVRLMQHAESEQARIAACNLILDRAYGKATQLVAGDPAGAAIKHAMEVAFVGLRRDS